MTRQRPAIIAIQAITTRQSEGIWAVGWWCNGDGLTVSCVWVGCDLWQSHACVIVLISLAALTLPKRRAVVMAAFGQKHSFRPTE